MSTNIGLTKSKLGQSSIKTTVSRSMAGAQRSTGASSAMSRTGSLFGIYAQRTSKGSGRHFSYLGYNDEQTWALRHSLNDSRTPVFNNITEGYPHYHEDNSNKGLGIAMGTMAGLGFLGALFGGLKEAGIIGKKEVVTDGKVESDSVSDNNPDFKGDTSALSAMSSANDSTTLRAAIDTATKKLTEMEDNLIQLGNELPILEDAAEKATEDLKTLAPKVKKAQEDVTTKEDVVDSKQTALDAAQKDRDAKLEIAKKMETAVGEAATNYTKASEALVNAEATLASTPETIIGPDGTEIPNEPAYSNAKQAVEIAEQQKEEAQTKLDEAKANHEKAVENYEKSITAYEEAVEAVKKAKQELDTAKTDLENAQEYLNNLKEQEKKANGDVAKYETALDNQKDLESDIKKYIQEIRSQNDRLTKMEQEEAKELKSLGDQMNKLAGKISERNSEIVTTDGLNVREKMKMRRNERNSERYAELAEKQKELEMRQNYTSLSDMPPEYTGVLSLTEFRKAEFGGETLYMIGGRPVTEQEYNTEIENAKFEEQLAPKINDPFAAIKSHEPPKLG